MSLIILCGVTTSPPYLQVTAWWPRWSSALPGHSALREPSETSRPSHHLMATWKTGIHVKPQALRGHNGKPGSRSSSFGLHSSPHLSQAVEIHNSLVSVESLLTSPVSQKSLSGKLDDHVFNLLLNSSSVADKARFFSSHAGISL